MASPTSSPTLWRITVLALVAVLGGIYLYVWRHSSTGDDLAIVAAPYVAGAGNVTSATAT